jgi:hypothetical protein
MRLVPVLLVVSTLIIPHSLFAQLAPPTIADGSDATYEQRYAELKELQAVPNRVAQVSGLVLTRDVAQFR